MLFGRDAELEYLESIYSDAQLKVCSVLGRRGVGKTALIQEFISGKRALYIEFVEGRREDLMAILRITLSGFTGIQHPDRPTLADYFEDIGDICRRERTILALDELPYLLESSPESASVIQRFIDTVLRGTSTMVVLCGSKASTMRKETEDPSRPLYGRIDHRLLLRPLSLAVCVGFHPAMPAEDQILTYLTVGGIPRYQRRMDGDDYLDTAIRHFMSDQRDLEDAGPSFVRAEIGNAAPHISLLARLGTGDTRLSEMADGAGLDRATASRALKELEEAGIVGRRHPMFMRPKKPSFYIEDNLVAFHYQVLHPLRHMVSGGVPDAGYVENRIRSYAGLRFELLCRDYVVSHMPVVEIGSWWGISEGEMTDIDIAARVADGPGRTFNLFAECKFTRKPVGFGTLSTLRARVESLDVDNVRLALFSVSGFEEDLVESAEEEGVLLIDADALLSGGERKRQWWYQRVCAGHVPHGQY